MRFAAVTDVALVACWTALVADSVRMARRERVARAGGDGSPPAVVRLLVLAALLLGAAVLERRTGGRLGFHPLAAVAGIGCAVGGLVLHMWARRALGAHWTSVVAAPADGQVVTGGPYALVRHPIYLAVLVLAAGTVLAHPSAATMCVAGGLAAGTARKIPAEERVLAAACGATWRRYAATVPMLLPRPSALLKRAWR